MKSSGRAQNTTHKVLGVIALTTILSAYAACGAPTQPPTSQQDWRTKIVQVPLPKKGCFTATYPSLQWREVTCTRAPKVPEAPAPASRGLGPETVGGGDSGDYAAEPPTGLITSATGSFPSVTGVTSETDSKTTFANYYILQLNTKPFKTTVCAGHPLCLGWQQFLFSNSGSYAAGAFIQYWLLQYNAMCPTGWGSDAPPGSPTNDCLRDGLNQVTVAPLPITNMNLMSLSLKGTATAGGVDKVFIVPGGAAGAMEQDSILDLASAWQGVEFNIFGAGGGSQAVFNQGSTINVETTIHYGGTAAPQCVMESYTGETNNLTLVGAPAFPTQPAPAIEFTESNDPSKLGGMPGCAMAAGTGDTHLRTFSGLYYDFQATGDFLLAQAQDFAVETRQVSGAPTWPNAAIDQAVATRMGDTRVALCPGAPVPGAAARGPLVVDGKHVDLADGQTLALPSGVRIVRTGNVYLVTDPSGNSLRAVLNSSATTTWIDVSVGLGTWPTPVRGLLANPNGNLNELAASDGTVFTTPIAFADLYGRYGESWRLAPADSLLAHCGGAARENSNPSQPFFARDLAAQAPDTYARARAICTNVGVKVPALLDACTLDVAVIGSEKAAAVYVGAPAPVAVGEAGQANQGTPTPTPPSLK